VVAAMYSNLETPALLQLVQSGHELHNSVTPVFAARMGSLTIHGTATAGRSAYRAEHAKGNLVTD
jgi:hypothetical protein